MENSCHLNYSCLTLSLIHFIFSSTKETVGFSATHFAHLYFSQTFNTVHVSASLVSLFAQETTSEGLSARRSDLSNPPCPPTHVNHHGDRRHPHPSANSGNANNIQYIFNLWPLIVLSTSFAKSSTIYGFIHYRSTQARYSGGHFDFRFFSQ